MSKNWKLTRRALTPMVLVRLYYFWKHRAVISSKAEVDLAPTTSWGQRCVISAFTKVKISGPFVMGQRCQISTGCFLGAGSAGLTLGDDVLVSPNCASKPVRIGHRVWVGSNSVILAGADIGDNAIVSAGSVVSGQVPPNSIVLGNPAKVISPGDR
jgi:acetyltransferase-like isoleucine patch superfamily enzyme